MPERHVYLAPWSTDRLPNGELEYVQPAGAVGGSIDLRPDPTQADGFAVHELAERRVDESGMLYLGDDRAALTPEKRDEFKARLGLEGDPGLPTVGEAVRFAFMEGADPARSNRSSGVGPTHTGRKRVWLGGRKIADLPWLGVNDPCWPNVRDRMQAGYAAMRAESVQLAGKWRECMRRKLRLTESQAGDLIPAAMRALRDPLVKPTTSIAETWNAANTSFGNISADQTWAQPDGNDFRIFSNAARNDGGSSQFSTPRCEVDLSSDDMSVACSVTPAEGISSLNGPAVRRSPSAETYYLGGVHRQFGQVRINKLVSGSSTSPASRSETITTGVTYAVTFIVDGSDLTLQVGGFSDLTASDGDIESIVRAGIGCFNFGSATIYAIFDGWSAADLVAGSTYEDSLSLSAEAGMTDEAALVMEAAATLSAGGGVSVLGLLDIEAAVSFPTASGLSSSGGLALDAAVAMAASAGVASQVSATISADVTIAAACATACSSLAVFETGVSLGHVAGLAALGNAILEAGLSLDCVSGVEFVGTKVIVAVTMPDGRTFRVRLETRSFPVPAETRTFRA